MTLSTLSTVLDDIGRLDISFSNVLSVSSNFLAHFRIRRMPRNSSKQLVPGYRMIYHSYSCVRAVNYININYFLRYVFASLLSIMSSLIPLFFKFCIFVNLAFFLCSTNLMLMLKESRGYFFLMLNLCSYCLTNMFSLSSLHMIV